MVRCFYDARELASFFRQESDRQRERCQVCGHSRDTCQFWLVFADKLLIASEICCSADFSGKDPRVFAALSFCIDVRFIPQPAT